MNTLKKILHILFPIGHLFRSDFLRLSDFDENDHLLDNNKEVKLSGKKVKLVTRYPLNIGLTQGKTYDVVEQITAYKPLKRVNIPITIAEIINDEGEVVLVTLVLFEEV